MATKIVTKNSSTASAVPTASDLVQGELAVNVADKRLFTEDNGGSIIELGTNPSTIYINAGSIDGTAIGASSASTGAFTTLTASGAFTSVGIDDNADATAITIDSSENVGIGTSTTVRKLTVNETGTSAIAHFESDQSASKGYFHDANTSQTYSVALGSIGDDMVFYASSGGSERMRIDSSGNVSIGTSATSAPLRVNVGTDQNCAINTSGGNPRITAFNDAVTASVPLGFNGSILKFETGGTERARIDSSGNLLVNSTTTSTTTKFQATGASAAFAGTFVNSAGSAAYGVAVSSGTGEAMYFYNGGTVGTPVGRVRTNSTTCFFENLSDQRLKENIEDADDAGSRIDALQVRKFDWKVDGSHQDYGMVAQELQAVAPEAVSPALNPEDMMGVDYSKLVPMLIKEIQSLRNRVAQLEE